MKHFPVILILLTMAIWLPAQGSTRPCRRSRTPWRFYRIESVIQVKGIVQAIHSRACYHDHRFVVLDIHTAKGKDLTVEVAPRSFLRIQPETGDSIVVKGSVVSCPSPQSLIIARQIEWRGKSQEFRDPNGFPLWHGIHKGRHRRERSSP